MNKLKLTRFKAFEAEATISLDGRKNLLLYGENGAGKSSIYEALKIVFFRAKLESQLTAQTPEDLEQLKAELWSSYNNKITNQNFEIEINDTSYDVFVTDNYQVFMISIEELAIENKINLKTLLEKFNFSLMDVTALCETRHQDIEAAVNAALALFKETVSIEIDEEDNYSIKIIDSTRRLERTLDIKSYFNEAKLNMIVLLILINSIELSKDGQKSKILVLDDFITSLDSSNRTFLIRYIIEKFRDTQVLLFTHNISFYNLIMYIIGTIDRTGDKWAFCNLYEINNSHKIYMKHEIEKIQDIKTAYESLADPAPAGDIENIGNRIRKRFEILLYEYSKLLMIGAVEDSKKILDRITDGKSAYYNNKKTASDLVDKIEEILQEGNANNLANRLQQKINNFKNQDFSNFQKTLRELKLYQKVTMHPMSHGVAGLSTFTTKEIEKSIELLDKMETYMNYMVDGNVVNV
jgi:energy-coupling factor transporter ATP-binding protein EcfA2